MSQRLAVPSVTARIAMLRCAAYLQPIFAAAQGLRHNEVRPS